MMEKVVNVFLQRILVLIYKILTNIVGCWSAVPIDSKLSPVAGEGHSGSRHSAPDAALPPQVVRHEAILEPQPVHLDHVPALTMVTVVIIREPPPPSPQAPGVPAPFMVRRAEGQLIEAKAEGQRAPGHWLALPHVKRVES